MDEFYSMWLNKVVNFLNVFLKSNLKKNKLDFWFLAPHVKVWKSPFCPTTLLRSIIEGRARGEPLPPRLERQTEAY